MTTTDHLDEAELARAIDSETGRVVFVTPALTLCDA